MFWISLFFIGACFGSFFNVVIYRLPLNESIMKGRSYCPNCYHQLLWYDLLPIISYLCLKGRCRYCLKKIRISHLVIEVIGGILFVYCFYQYVFYKMIIVYFISMLLLVIALIDLKTFNIYDITIFILFILTIIYRLLTSFDILDMIAGSLVISSLMMGINIFIKDGFGIGDIELMFVSGILLGFNNIIIAFMIAIITGGIYSLFLLLLKKTTMHSYIPFAPFLTGAIFFMLQYDNIFIF
ncbi:hypothetical protein B5E92_06830 [Erysipelatoclostridium sp. An15]|uniref:prepilin peptidase n=1 Tax=Erysipelatoclostridium sp. An15 TaxID=1965566 RepID=UPI000B3682C1|nr:A24 family peptidase [Erysipelatoclostridium sp. An15]OUQ07694.1 hypothetical protein B5E92_06830 [Erysipelatoclostridium sp. An15]